jgi:hypothetical protein
MRWRWHRARPENRPFPHVERKCDGGLAAGVQREGKLLRSLEIDVADGHLAAAGMDFARDSLAHATGAAGDQGAAPLEGEAAVGGKGEGVGHRELSVLVREMWRGGLVVVMMAAAMGGAFFGKALG